MLATIVSIRKIKRTTGKLQFRTATAAGPIQRASPLLLEFFKNILNIEKNFYELNTEIMQ